MYTFWKSLFFFNDSILLSCLKEEEKTTKAVAYADNFFLPFNLLAANTFLPPAVLILFLKPCTLFLEHFFGWNVIFILVSTSSMLKNIILNYIKKPSKVKQNLLFFRILYFPVPSGTFPHINMNTIYIRKKHFFSTFGIFCGLAVDIPRFCCSYPVWKLFSFLLLFLRLTFILAWLPLFHILNISLIPCTFSLFLCLI